MLRLWGSISSYFLYQDPLDLPILPEFYDSCKDLFGEECIFGGSWARIYHVWKNAIKWLHVGKEENERHKIPGKYEHHTPLNFNHFFGFYEAWTDVRESLKGSGNPSWHLGYLISQLGNFVHLSVSGIQNIKVSCLAGKGIFLLLLPVLKTIVTEAR